MEPYKVKLLVSIYAKKDQKWPSQCQPSHCYTDKSRHSHTVRTLCVHLPTSPYPALAGGGGIDVDIPGSDIMKMKVYGPSRVMGPQELINTYMTVTVG